MNLVYVRPGALFLFFFLLGTRTPLFSADSSSLVDTAWTGAAGTAWADPVNWSKGLPSEKGVANTVIQATPRNIAPIIATAGNTSSGQVYIMSGGGLTIQKGGELTTGGNLVTGNNGHADLTEVSGGTLHVRGFILLGHNGHEGSLKIDSGTVSAEGLSIHDSGAAKIVLLGSGKLTLPYSEDNLRNVRYWIDNTKLIKAEGKDSSMEYSVDVDTEKEVGKIVLTVWSGK